MTGITVSSLAATKITEELSKDSKQDSGLRVYVQGGGCSGFQYGLIVEDGPGVGDQVFESNGIRLYVDPISVRYLKGAEIDWIDNIAGGGFTIRNPNAKSTCGCGQSFQAD
jgi:iron-sulfur cluster assembly accessory protein